MLDALYDILITVYPRFFGCMALGLGALALAWMLVPWSILAKIFLSLAILSVAAGAGVICEYLKFPGTPPPERGKKK